LKEHQIPLEEFEQIERYLSGQMGKEEYEQFIRRIDTDPQFTERVKQTQLLLLGIKETALTDTLEDFHSEVQGVKATSAVVHKLRPAGKMWVAAVSITVIAILAFLWVVNGESEKDKVFSTYFEPDPGLMTAMSADEDYTFSRAMVDYKYGRYREAIRQWEQLPGTALGNDTLNYFIGVAWLADEQPAKAIPYLERVISNRTGAFVKDATWYLGLALAKEGKKKEAIQMLRQSEHPEKADIIQSLQ